MQLFFLVQSWNQSEDDFENFCNTFELTLNAVSVTNPFLIGAIGDFNTRSSHCYTGERTNSEGSNTDAITSQFGLQQIINEPTHSQRNSVPCINLIFFSQTNLVMSPCIHSSLHWNCHHKIIFAKFDLKVHYPPCEREVWHFKKANTDDMERAINGFPWKSFFCQLRYK